MSGYRDILIDSLVKRHGASVSTGDWVGRLEAVEKLLHFVPTHRELLEDRVTCLMALDRQEELPQACRALAKVCGDNATALLASAAVRLFRSGRKPKYLNLGGGPQYEHPFWINLEDVGGPLNPHPFQLGPEMVVPVEDKSIELVYFSHAIEHLDDQTVTRALSEILRVLSDTGLLLLKLPDFDSALKAWKEGDAQYFDDRWGYRGVVASWAEHGVADTIDTRASMVFSSYANAGYGNIYTGRTSVGPAPYHGPPRSIARIAAHLKRLDSPNEIARVLKNAVLAEEPNPLFNHQNAWGKSELEVLLRGAGFRVLSWDGKQIASAHSWVPEVATNFSISTYCLAARDGIADGTQLSA